MCWTDDAKANGSDPSATISMKRNKTALGGARSASDIDRPPISQMESPRMIDIGNRRYGLLFSDKLKYLIALMFYLVTLDMILFRAIRKCDV